MNTRRWTASIISFVVLVATMAVGLASAPSASASPKERDPGGKPSAAALAAPGEISLTITTPDGGTVSGYVDLYRWDPEFEYFDYYDGGYAEESASPHEVVFEAPPGDYYASFYDSTDVYDYGLSNGATEAPSSPADPGSFTLTPDEGVDATIALTLAAPRVAVTGLVQNAAGDPLEDIYVWADGRSYDESYTAADGSYRLDLRPGTYDLYFEDENYDYNGAQITVEVGDGPTAVETVQLQDSGRRRVSGQVLSASGSPLEDADVQLYQLYDYDEDGTFDDHDYVNDAYTDNEGNYVLRGAQDGETYTVAGDGPGHGFTVLGGGLVVEEGTPLLVDGANVEAPDLQLREASTVGGVVSGPDGPAEEVEVQLYRWDEFDEYFYTEDYAYTDEEGGYSFNSLDPGFYTLYFDPYSSQDLSPAWLEGSERPTSTTDAGVFEVTETPTALTRNKTLARSQGATGRVTDADGNGLEDGSVVSYVYNEEFAYWYQYGQTRTNEDGSYRVRVPASSTVTFRFARGGFTSQFLGGGSSLPETPDATNSRTTDATGDLVVGDVALAPFQSKLGKVAGQDLAYCRDHVLPANDDSSSEEVPVPFDLRFFGSTQDTLFVNNNGNVTFGNSLRQYTPSDLTGATDLPIIAPFFADVDTYGEGSNVVTYGSSPDGETFCVNWADVGYYASNDDKLNTFQLLLTKNTAGAGRSPGDFDITFNYDEILWETGDASGGSGGTGGTSAAVGFSAGTGEAGTFVQLPGSFDNGALLDGGANALVSSSQNSSQLGRYVFQVRNEGLTDTLGDLQGSVIDGRDHSPEPNAYVQACRTDESGCLYTSTSSGGRYSFTAVPTGAYEIAVWPADDGLFAGGTTDTVEAGEVTEVPAIVLEAPVPQPENVTINGTESDGVPGVSSGSPVELRVTGCAGIANPTYTVTLASGVVVRNALAMTESPAGTYSATIAPFGEDTGPAQITTNVPATCGGAPTEFNIYIDPSGIVTDQFGRPLVGATVTLLRSDTAAGPFTEVPDGSTVMSPSNRSNPSITDDTGYFRWDVTAGWYKVRAEFVGCDTTTTDGMEVPPERIDLLIPMECTAAAPVPTTAPSITGVAKVGQTITAQSATWSDPLEETDLELLRNGVALPGTSHQLTDGDVGAVFTARSTGQRPDYVQENGTGETVEFESAQATSAGATGVEGDAPVPTTPARVTGTGKVGTNLTAVAPVWSLPGTTSTERQWLRNGEVIAGATGATYTVAPGDIGQDLAVRFTGEKAGHSDGSSTSAPVKGSKYTSSTTAAIAKKKITTKKKGKVTVTVVAPGLAGPAGVVQVKEGAAVLASATLRAANGGKVVVTLPKLKKGKHTLTATYVGDAITQGSTSSAVVLKVIKKKKRR